MSDMEVFDVEIVPAAATHTQDSQGHLDFVQLARIQAQAEYPAELFAPPISRRPPLPHEED